MVSISYEVYKILEAANAQLDLGGLVVYIPPGSGGVEVKGHVCHGTFSGHPADDPIRSAMLR